MTTRSISPVRATLARATLPLGLLGCLGGCVERELVIDSAPQGALVFLNDQEVGRTPLTREFTWYGTYDVAVRAEGYETLKAQTPVIAPWWQWLPFDLVAEVMPFTFKDSRKLSYSLQPVSEAAADPDRLVRRGEGYREKLRSGEKPVTTRPLPTTQRATKPPTWPASDPAAH